VSGDLRKLLLAANHHVERDGVAGDDAERVRLRDQAGLAPDHDAELGFVVGAAVGKPDGDAFRWPDQGTRRLQEQPLLLDRARPVFEVDCDLRVVLGLLDMSPIVHRRTDDLGRIGDGAEKPDAIGGLRWRLVGQPLQLRPQAVEVGDEVIAERRRIAQRRQRVENGRHVMHVAAAHEADPVVVETAELHGEVDLVAKGA
jgi:hypothetical protein